MEIRMPGYHPTIWGKGEIVSHPIWSDMIKGYVLMFRPESRDFTIPVPADEFETE
jgi:hypothetical protein